MRQQILQFNLIVDVQIFHAGTAITPSGDLVTAGGRVVDVTAIGPTLTLAVNSAYEAMHGVQFDKMHFRKDIAGR